MVLTFQSEHRERAPGSECLSQHKKTRRPLGRYSKASLTAIIHAFRQGAQVCQQRSSLALATAKVNQIMDRSRIAPRKRVLKSGIIDLGAGGTIPCSVKNISKTGALIETNTPLFIPDKFKLIVESERLNRSCQVVWRKEKRMGVEFK